MLCLQWLVAARECVPWLHVKRLTWRVPTADGGQELIDHLARRSGLPPDSIGELLQKGAIFVDGRRTHQRTLCVRPGSQVAIHLELPSPLPQADLFPKERILYLDEHLVFVNKPPFVPSQATMGSDQDTLVQRVGSVLDGDIRLVHRLDAQTSGVIVLARSAQAHLALSEMFRKGDVDKTYRALTSRPPSPPHGTIEARLGPHPRRRDARAVRADGETACTHYDTLLVGHAALVEARPRTGRTHQIRVHLAHLGAPLLGDRRYGGAALLREVVIARVMLHAARLSLRHPLTGEHLHVHAETPPDFREVAERLIAEVSVRPELLDEHRVLPPEGTSSA